MSGNDLKDNDLQRNEEAVDPRVQVTSLWQIMSLSLFYDFQFIS